MMILRQSITSIILLSRKIAQHSCRKIRMLSRSPRRNTCNGSRLCASSGACGGFRAWCRCGRSRGSRRGTFWVLRTAPGIRSRGRTVEATAVPRIATGAQSPPGVRETLATAKRELKFPLTFTERFVAVPVPFLVLVAIANNNNVGAKRVCMQCCIN